MSLMVQNFWHIYECNRIKKEKTKKTVMFKFINYGKNQAQDAVEIRLYEPFSTYKNLKNVKDSSLIFCYLECNLGGSNW